MKVIINAFSLIILCGISFTTHATDYSANYRLIAKNNGKEIGFYRVSLKRLTKPHLYQQQGEIYFTYPGLLKNVVYHYKDIVLFDKQLGVISLAIDIQDKTNIKINGFRSKEGNQLILRKFSPDEDNKLLEEKIVDRDEYDLTLFAFRFPKPCDNTAAAHPPYKARILDVVNWRITSFASTFIPSDKRANYIPSVSWPTISNACLFLVKSHDNKGDRISWISPEGYLIYETTSLYNMILDEGNSTLPIPSLGIMK